MNVYPYFRECYAKRFVDLCENKFGWHDLADDIVMDVGCGGNEFCGKAILDKFPKVKAIIGIDSNPMVVNNFNLKPATKMLCQFADIEIWQSLRNYEGWMNKVISTNVFHKLVEKENAFRNIYQLLKPGGEAGVSFVVNCSMNEWLMEMLKESKLQNSHKNPYDNGLGADQYQEMVEKIGFQVIECKERERFIPFESDEICKSLLYQMCKNLFNIPSKLLKEFKKDCLEVYLKLKVRNKEGKLFYRYKELYVLLIKPREGSDSKTEEKLCSSIPALLEADACDSTMDCGI